IGSNDLTQLTLGLDRDSSIVASLFDERDPAVKKLLSMAIKTARAKGKYIGICGQGPSDHPDLAEWLMEQGIESVSLNPDTVVDTWLRHQSAFFFASRSQVSTTVSGFSDTDSMPCSISHSARSGWSLGPWPQMPMYLPLARAVLIAIDSSFFTAGSRSSNRLATMLESRSRP